jgi:hypothetical protein
MVMIIGSYIGMGDGYDPPMTPYWVIVTMCMIHMIDYMVLGHKYILGHGYYRHDPNDPMVLGHNIHIGSWVLWA